MNNCEYIDNIDYVQNTRQPTIENLLQQLKECISIDVQTATLYDIIRKQIIRQIKLSDLAITRIMPDLVQLRKENAKQADIVQFLLANPEISYSDIGKQFNISKPTLIWHWKRLQAKFFWLKNYLEIKNENYNRNRTYKQGGRP